MSLRHATRGLVRLVLAGWPAVVAAQVPAGPDFTINTYTTGYQNDANAAMHPGGSFIVAWRSIHDSGTIGVFAQRFDASGARLGAEFQVNTYTTQYQYDPALAIDAGGSFVVVWSSFPQDGSYGGVFGQRYDAAGTPRGAEFQINVTTTGNQNTPDVAAAPQGGFIVSWVDRVALNDMDVIARRFDGAGAPIGGEFRVNTYTTGYQYPGKLAVRANGDFLVAWAGRGPGDPDSGIFARRYDGGGNPLGAEFLVNTYTTFFQSHPALAVTSAGDFVVVWDGGLGYDVYGQRFDAAGNRRGTEFRVNAYTTASQERPRVSVDAEGDFVVAWNSYHDGGYSNVFAQRFDAGGVRRGAEFRVNTYTTGNQFGYADLADATGNFLVTWRSNQDGSAESVQGQRFGGLRPAALAVDEPDNDVWEPGELAEVKPSWHNVNGAAQSFGGVLTNITGPPGATYGIADNTASYGSVPNGATAACTDCYVVLVSNPASRPIQHWDASVLETITPDAQGQVKRWALHIGGSFTDVPAGNAFYRFVETLLHKGITGGCGAGIYCPGNATTRDQMSVFVLVAKEGSGYAPPACAPPNIFNDVPESNPFCAWIEELSNRGVVSGCGGGNYCPANPVTREQMAVFVLRTLDPALDPPACVAGSELFADVPASSGFCKWIEELARRQVVTGCGGGNYCPAASVTREQMGVFICVTFGLTLY